MPNGFELETPSFWYLMKAGMAFTLGAGIVTVLGALTWMFVSFTLMGALFRGLAR